MHDDGHLRAGKRCENAVPFIRAERNTTATPLFKLQYLTPERSGNADAVLKQPLSTVNPSTMTAGVDTEAEGRPELPDHDSGLSMTASPPSTSREEIQLQTSLLTHDAGLSIESANAPSSTTIHENAGIQASFEVEMEDENGQQGYGFNDNDSAFGESLIGCDTDTLASYITDYRYENGRRYHAYRDGEYWVFPFSFFRLTGLGWFADILLKGTKRRAFE